MIRFAEYDDLQGIIEIYNDAILNTTSIYTYKAHRIEDQIVWYETKLRDEYPVLVYVDDDHQVQGFASFGPFRAYPAYKYTIEHSIYVHKDHRRKNIGTRLLQALMQIAEEQGYATMVGAIDAANEGSRFLHEQLGFTYAGTINKAGYKFGRWLDLVFYQYQLRGPETPTEE